MATETKENYLKALFHLHQKSPEISITSLGQNLDVSKPTVNNMVKKLVTKGWVKYEKYKPLKLTKNGLRKAALIVRKHRLAEMYLVEKMGFGWEEVHHIAEELEHISAQVFFDRMDEALGFPKYDPHGSLIPDKNGNIMSEHFKPLSEFHIGQKVILKALNNSSIELLKYLDQIELKLSDLILIEHKEPFDQSMIVSFDPNKEIMVSKMVSECLLVQPV